MFNKSDNYSFSSSMVVYCQSTGKQFSPSDAPVASVKWTVDGCTLTFTELGLKSICQLEDSNHMNYDIEVMVVFVYQRQLILLFNCFCMSYYYNYLTKHEYRASSIYLFVALIWFFKKRTE